MSIIILDQFLFPTVNQSQPQLRVVLLLHCRDDLATVLKKVRLLECTHELRLDYVFIRRTPKNLVGGCISKANCDGPGEYGL